MPAVLTPRFKHDCFKCHFEGRFGLYDVYTCPGADRDNDSLIARNSNKGPDYSSSPRCVFVTMVTDHLTGMVNTSGPKLPGWAVAILSVIYGEEDSTMFGIAWDTLQLVRQKYIACECGAKKEKCEWCKKASALDIK